MSQLCIELIKGLFTLTAVALGSYIALRVYFRQKEYELVKQRYLEGSIDLIAAQLESTLGTVSHNWARSMQICKSFRDTENDFDISELTKGFLEFDNSKFQQIAHYRLGSLIQSQAAWSAFQSTLAWANAANNMFVREVPEAIRIRCTTDRIKMGRPEMAEQIIADMRARHDEVFKYANLQAELHKLGKILESEQLSWKAIEKFSLRPNVKNIVKDILALNEKEEGVPNFV